MYPLCSGFPVASVISPGKCTPVPILCRLCPRLGFRRILRPAYVPPLAWVCKIGPLRYHGTYGAAGHEHALPPWVAFVVHPASFHGGQHTGAGQLDKVGECPDCVAEIDVGLWVQEKVYDIHLERRVQRQ